MSPLLYLKLGVLVVGMAGSAWAAHKATSNAWKADLLEAERAHTEALIAEIERTNTVAAELEVERGKSKTIYKTITKRVDKIIDRPVYRNVCLDDDGLRLVRAAIAGQAPDSGEPVSPLPKPTPLRGRDGRPGP
jgi:hypothetical protein